MYEYAICFLKRDDELLLLNRTFTPNVGLWNGVGGMPTGKLRFNV